MLKYGQIINNETGLCQIGTGTNIEFYKSIGYIELDVKQSDIDNNYYLIDKCPMKTEEDKTRERENEFNSQFFNTSLGYVKRKVTMKDGSIKDFLSDILPILQVDVPIITYNMPDFTKEEMPTQNLNVKVTTQFIAECKQQVLADFYGA